jgi:excisionase family DNA binding protein
MPLERDGRRYLSTSEVQGQFDRSHEWLRIRAHDGRLQQHRLTAGNKIHYDAEQVARLIADETHIKETKHAVEPPPDVSRFMTVKQVASALGFNRSYIDKLIKQGKLPATNIGGDSRATDIRVRVEDYEAFVKQREKVGA